MIFEFEQDCVAMEKRQVASTEPFAPNFFEVIVTLI